MKIHNDANIDNSDVLKNYKKISNFLRFFLCFIEGEFSSMWAFGNDFVSAI